MQLNYASFISRYFAFLIDALILFIPLYAIKYYIGDIGVFPSHFLPHFTKITNTFILQTAAAAAIYLVYLSLFDSSKLQATPGKLAMGLKIVNGEGARPALAQTLLRSFVKAFTMVTLNLLFIVCLFTKKGQNIHDFAGGTYVVYGDPKKPPGT